MLRLFSYTNHAWKVLLLGLILAARLESAFADPALDKAQAFLHSGRADAATTIYNAYLQRHPASFTAELALAQIAVRQFEYAKARTILEKTLAQHPESAITAASLGRLFQLWSNGPSGKVADNSRNYLALAQEHFRQAVAIDPNHPLVLTYVAEWQLQQDDLISAEKGLTKALQINPSCVPAFQGLTRLYMKAKDTSRAKDAVLHAMDLDATDPMNYFLTAQLLAAADRPAQAVKYAEKSDQLDFGHLPDRDYLLASQYEKLGEHQKALQYYTALTQYTPRDATIWVKIGDLYDALHQEGKSTEAYQHALAIQPDIMNDMRQQARANTRAERIDTALPQWRRLLALRATKPDLGNEALGSIAGLRYLQRFYHPEQAPDGMERDMALFDSLTPTDASTPTMQLDRIKLSIALQGKLSDVNRQTLSSLLTANEPEVAGEAAFLLSDYGKSNENLEAVDGLSAEGYTHLADRLLLDQELVFSKVFYERAYQLEPNPSLEAAMKRIQAKQNLAEQRLTEGNVAFNDKKYQDAIDKYLEAAHIYCEWDNVYLRLGDTYQHVHRFKDAKQAFDNAISLTPSLMDSQGFAKNYHKLAKKAAKK